MKTLEVKKIEFVEFLGIDRPYDVVDRNLSPAPKYFVGYGNGRPFISDEVPEGYRTPMVIHELTEFEGSDDSNNKCLNALREELKVVPSNQLRKYMEFRHGVFSELIGFLERHDSGSAFIPRARRSLDYLASHK